MGESFSPDHRIGHVRHRGRFLFAGAVETFVNKASEKAARKSAKEGNANGHEKGS
jgi:hypothetical protein